MDTDVSPVLVGLVLFAIFIVLILLVIGSRRAAKKRTEEFAKIAQDLGLTFYPRGEQSIFYLLSDFHLFSQGRSFKTANMLHGQTGDVEVALFDFRFTTGSTSSSTSGTRSSRAYEQSVIFLRSPSLDFPHFAVRPEGLFHKIGSVLGYQDIDFSSRPKFSKDYLLRGSDEEAVRGLFTDSVLAYFENQSKVSVEAKGDRLILYRFDTRIQAEQVPSFMEEGTGLLKLFEG